MNSQTNCQGKTNLLPAHKLGVFSKTLLKNESSPQIDIIQKFLIRKKEANGVDSLVSIVGFNVHCISQVANLHSYVTIITTIGLTLRGSRSRILPGQRPGGPTGQVSVDPLALGPTTWLHVTKEIKLRLDLHMWVLVRWKTLDPNKWV